MIPFRLRIPECGPAAVAVMLTALFAIPAPADEQSQLPDEILLREALVIKPVGRSGRYAVHTDAIEAQFVAGKWTAPKPGDKVALPDGGSQTWEPLKAGKDDWFESPALGGGYAYCSVNADAERVLILEATGHGMVYVNGEPRAGDPYQTGNVRLPVLLHKGGNDFLFQGVRGRLRAKLVAPKAEVVLDTRDATLPDLITGEAAEAWAAVVLQNASNRSLGHLALRATRTGTAATVTPLPDLSAVSIRKVGFRLEGPAPAEPGNAPVQLDLLQKDGGGLRTLDGATVTLRVRRPRDNHRVTFRSAIDGSVQYYAVNPAQPFGREAPPPALFLTLHGAAVEATGQADAYSGKTWGHLVAPTNRRPFGFDWEDWGRLDALEVLDLAQKQLHTDPQRTYLTGHSMGGHGTWQIGALFPDRFAAIGPSAGWISFWSYTGAKLPDNPTPIDDTLVRSSKTSDTLALAHNYAQHGVYVLHGDKDDNVPVGQARTMKNELAGFHHDFMYHEQPGAGHWWDASDEPGADCVDWAPMFDFFARHVIPRDDSIRQVDFATANPGVSAWSHWVGIEAQQHALEVSSVSIRFDPGKRRFVGTTDNVARLFLDLRVLKPGGDIVVELDGHKLEKIPWQVGIWLKHEDGKWSPLGAPPADWKGPARSGPFKDVFRNRMLFVYGTKGTAEENAWAYAKARYDAETFWYRGNGSVDLVADTAFDPSADRDRNVIVYGNADSNAAWKGLLADSPVQVRRGKVRVGEREETGDDLGCLFLRPRPGSDKAAVGVVAGSGAAGMRLTDRLPYFISGVGYPDCLLLGADTLSQGSAGIRAAGFFGQDWGVASGEFAWRR